MNCHRLQSFGVFKAVVTFVAVLWLGTCQTTCASAELAQAPSIGKAESTERIVGFKRQLLRKRPGDQITGMPDNICCMLATMMCSICATDADDPVLGALKTCHVSDGVATAVKAPARMQPATGIFLLPVDARCQSFSHCLACMDDHPAVLQSPQRCLASLLQSPMRIQ